MNKKVDLHAFFAILVLGAAPVTAYDGGMECFGSVFFIVFAAYCALIIVSHLVEFLRLRLSGKAELAGSEPDTGLDKG